MANEQIGVRYTSDTDFGGEKSKKYDLREIIHGTKEKEVAKVIEHARVDGNYD